MNVKHMTLLAFAGLLTACAQASQPIVPPEFTHPKGTDWINSPPLTLAGLKGKVVLVEFWTFECINCLNSRPWLQSIVQSKGPAGLVVVAVHTPELPEEQSAENVRRAVSRLGIRDPVMLDADYSYWKAMQNQYWPAFYLIGRDGLLYGKAEGELHIGDEAAHRVETAIDQLLKAKAP